ncbi:hypothetical protein [Antrihabitans spumae]|jgi:hypothetical protein|uniref:Uncharacterized protein n=1 Tax=Antrihabitans spumae TaxID=3373370 RepID=A0ABW7KVA7_9NOCA
MSLPDEQGTKGVKTLGIKLRPDVHAQLSFIAQLRDGTITDEIQIAITTHIARAKDDPELRSRADAVQAEIEREAVARRDAIATLFASSPELPLQADSSNETSGRPRAPRRAKAGEVSPDS